MGGGPEMVPIDLKSFFPAFRINEMAEDIARTLKSGASGAVFPEAEHPKLRGCFNQGRCFYSGISMVEGTESVRKDDKS